jgi:hypothetical protein
MLYKLLAVTCMGFAFGSSPVVAQQGSNDLVSKVIISLFKDHNRKFLCLSENSSLPAIRAAVEADLSRMPAGSAESENAIASVIYTKYPCPFSPIGKAVRPASAKDIEGVWLFPETSQRLRFGPDSPLWQKHAALPIKCEAVAYYDNAEARVVQIVGQMPCPFSSARDMDVSRRNPKVSNWSLPRDGRLKIDRTDVPGHIEEWDIFVAESPFQVANITINAGDLLAYLRREQGNEFNASTTFRHLKRLP